MTVGEHNTLDIKTVVLLSLTDQLGRTVAGVNDGRGLASFGVLLCTWLIVDSDIAIGLKRASGKTQQAEVGVYRIIHEPMVSEVQTP